MSALMNWKKWGGGGGWTAWCSTKDGHFLSTKKNCQAHFLFLALTAALAHCKNKTRTAHRVSVSNILENKTLCVCVAFGRLEFFLWLFVCLFPQTRAFKKDTNVVTVGLEYFLICFFFLSFLALSLLFGWAFNIITKLMLFFWLLCRFSLSCL